MRIASDGESNRRAVKAICQSRAAEGSIRKAVLSAVADDVEWWVAGDRERLPWAGLWRGKEGVEAFFDTLNAHMDYEQFEVLEVLADGDTVIERVRAAGKAVETERPFGSEVIRTWHFRGGKADRVESHCDTAAYQSAMGRP